VFCVCIVHTYSLPTYLLLLVLQYKQRIGMHVHMQLKQLHNLVNNYVLALYVQDPSIAIKETVA